MNIIDKIKIFLKKERLILGLRVANYHFLLFSLIFAGCLFLRVCNLGSLPVFVDEAIYIRWGQLIKSESTLRFVPLQDGKQPLFMWLTAGFLKFVSDPLIAGRLVSVFSGLATMVGAGVLAGLLTKKTSSLLWGMFLYLLVPYALFFDRMALVDSLLACFGVWSILLAIVLGREKRLDIAMILGIVLGLAMLTKSPAIFFVVFSPLLAVVYGFSKKNKKELLVLFGLVGISLGFALSIYTILKLGPNFHMIAIRNKDYVWPLSEIAKHPLDPLIPHLKDVWRYYLGYLTLPVIVLGIIGMAKLVTKDWRNLILLFWWLVPLIGQSAIGKTFTARYILYTVPLFLVFAAVAVDQLSTKFKITKINFLVKGLLVFGLIFSVLRFDWLLLSNPSKAILPRDERQGYLQDWTSGWGIKQSAEYIKSLSKDISILVGTEGYFGTLPDGLLIYLDKEPEVTVIGVGYPISSIPQSLSDNIKAGNRSFLLVNMSRFLVENQIGLDLIKEYPKPGGDKLLLFELQ